MIELHLKINEARKLLALLAEQCVDPVLAEIHERLAGPLQAHDHHKENLPPWRKVIGINKTGVYHFEHLECGHKFMVPNTKNWQADYAKKRRCKSCGEA